MSSSSRYFYVKNVENIERRDNAVEIEISFFPFMFSFYGTYTIYVSLIVLFL